MSEAIKCARSACGKEITNKTEVEYSQEFSEFYCNYDCAVDALFDRARCTPFQFEQDEMNENEVELRNGELFHTE